MISFNKVKEIFDTLPVGYYLGRRINNKLDDSDKSYFDPGKMEIHVGYKQLPLDMLNEDDLDSVEDDVRCLLYHEISHAILTPKTMKMTRVINTFEDQRIETLLKDYYKRVDFKSFVKKVNHYTPGAPISSAFELFYAIVRFNDGPEEFVKRVYEIIYNYKSLDCNSTSTAAADGSKGYFFYIEDIEKLYDYIKNS